MIASEILKNVRTVVEIALALVSILAIAGLIGAKADEKAANDATAEAKVELRAAQDGKMRSEAASAVEVLIVRASCSSWRDEQSENIDDIVTRSLERLQIASDSDILQTDLSELLPDGREFDTWRSPMAFEELVAIGANLRDEAITSASGPIVR